MSEKAFSEAWQILRCSALSQIAY